MSEEENGVKPEEEDQVEEEVNHKKRGREEDHEATNGSSHVKEEEEAAASGEGGDESSALGAKKVKLEDGIAAPAGGGGGGEEGNECLVKLKGLPWKCTKKDVEAFLEGVEIPEEGIKIFDYKSGTAFVKLGSKEEELKALAKDKQRLGKRFIDVFASTGYELEAARKKGFKSSSGPRGYVRMRGLPYNATDAEIQKFFAGHGIAQGGVHVVFDHSGRPSGQAFVEFETVEEAHHAVKLDKEKIGDRWIDLFLAAKEDMYRAIPTLNVGPAQAAALTGGSRIGAGARSGSTDLQYVVKVRGLPFDCTRMDLMEFFRSTNPRENAIFFINRMDGKASGEAFVVLDSHDAIKKALELDKQKMGSRWLDIFESHTGDLLSRVGAGVALSNKNDAGYKGVLKMRGLPFQVTVEEIKQFFQGYSMQSNGIFITTGADGRATGDAYVIFQNEGEAERAKESLNKQSIMGRWVDLYQATKGDVYTATVYSPIVGQAAGGCPVYTNVPMTCARMKHLPPSVNEDDLFRFFSGLQVIGLYICRDQGGRSTGEAYAEFGSLDDCQKAMSRNKSTLPQGDRHVDVTAASKEQVLELIEAEKKGETYNMGGGGGYAQSGGYGGGPPVDYASMARGGHPAPYTGGRGWAPHHQQQQSHHHHYQQQQPPPSRGSYGGGGASGGRGGGGGQYGYGQPSQHHTAPTPPPAHHRGGGGYAVGGGGGQGQYGYGQQANYASYARR